MMTQKEKYSRGFHRGYYGKTQYCVMAWFLCKYLSTKTLLFGRYCFLAWFSGEIFRVTVFWRIRPGVLTEQMAVKLGMLMQYQLLIPKINKSHFCQKFELLCFGFVRQYCFQNNGRIQVTAAR